MRAQKVAGHEYLCEMKVGIVVPYSWSFWGAVVEHAELQAAALRKLGHDVRLVMGNDPPGSFTRVLHPRLGRHGEPPPEVIPIGRSVIVPANGSLPNIILSPRSIFRIKRVLETERFDLLHLHEPMTPTPCVAALALAKCPLVATFHASGELSWLKPAKPVWGFLLDRLDHRIAVSEPARETAARYFPGDYELIPNGVLIPDRAEAGSPDDTSSSSAARSLGRACRSCFARGPRSGGGRGRGFGSSAPTRLQSGSSSRAFASPTTESTCSASSPRTS